MLCLPSYDIQYPFYIEKKVRQANNTIFSPVLGLTLIVLVWLAAWVASRFLAECFEVSKTKHERFLMCVLYHPLILTVCFGFFFNQSWSGKVPAFWGIRKSALVLAEFLSLIQQEDERRGNSVKFVPALGTVTAGLLNLISSFWCWRCSSEQDPKTNLIFLQNHVTTLDEPSSQWAAIR